MSNTYIFTLSNNESKWIEADSMDAPNDNRPTYVLLKDGKRVAEIAAKYVVAWEMQDSGTGSVVNDVVDQD